MTLSENCVKCEQNMDEFFFFQISQKYDMIYLK